LLDMMSDGRFDRGATRARCFHADDEVGGLSELNASRSSTYKSRIWSRNILYNL